MFKTIICTILGVVLIAFLANFYNGSFGKSIQTANSVLGKSSR